MRTKSRQTRWRGVLPGIAGIGASLVVLLKRWGPSRIPFDTVDPEQAAVDGSQFVDLLGLCVRVRVAGEGSPALVLLHGYAASVFTWHEVFEPLSRLGTVIAFDRPAHGLTSRPLPAEWTGSNPYSLEAQAELTAALLDHFEIDRAILIGHSAGGTVAVQTALCHPERIESLILVAPAVFRDLPPPAWLRSIFALSVMDRCGPWLARRIAGFGDLIMNRAWHDPSRITPEIREGYRQAFAVRGWGRGMLELARANRTIELDSHVSRLRMPVLVVTGDDDHVVPVRQSERLARELPKAKLEVMPDCGHIPPEEKPEQFLAIVTQFIRTGAKIES